MFLVFQADRHTRIFSSFACLTTILSIVSPNRNLDWSVRIILFHKNQQISVEARMSLFLIHVLFKFSLDPDPKYMPKILLGLRLHLESCLYSNFEFLVFEILNTHESHKVLKKKEKSVLALFGYFVVVVVLLSSLLLLLLLLLLSLLLLSMLLLLLLLLMLSLLMPLLLSLLSFLSLLLLLFYCRCNR